MSNHGHSWRPRPYPSPREHRHNFLFESETLLNNTYHSSPPRTRISSPARTRASTPAQTLTSPSHRLVNRRQEVDDGTEQDPRVLHHLLKTMAVPLNELTNVFCPICQDPYVEHIPNAPPSTYGAREYPVRILSLYPYTQCRCVFGINCIRKIFQGRESWCDRCPLCREEWFPTYEEIGAMIAARNAEETAGRDGDGGGSEVRVEAPAGLSPGVGMLPRQRSRVRIHEAPEVVSAHNSPQVLDLSNSRRASLAPAPPSTPTQGLSNRGRLQRTLGFLERIVSEFDVNDRDGEITNMIAAIEMVAEDLWQRLEAIRRMRDQTIRRDVSSPRFDTRQGRVGELRHRE